MRTRALKLAHPGLDPQVERLSCELAAQQPLNLSQRRGIRLRKVLALVTALHVVIAHPHERSKAYGDVSQDRRLTPSRCGQKRMLGRALANAAPEIPEGQRVLLGRAAGLREASGLLIHEQLVDQQLERLPLVDALELRRELDLAQEHGASVDNRQDALDDLRAIRHGACCTRRQQKRSGSKTRKHDPP